MISTRDQGFVIKADVWSRAHEVIRRSHAAGYIEQLNAQYRGAGGRKATAVVPSIEAVLTTGLALIMIGKPASISGIHRALCELEPDQRARCGFAAKGEILAYSAFANWLTRKLEAFDPGSDLVARRMLNQDHQDQLAARTPEQQKESELARERRDALVNLIVAGSVDERCLEGYAGDVVADETIIDLAGASEGLGVRPDKFRAAAYAGAYYMRDKTHRLGTGEKMREVTKRGFGIGVTALSRVGSADDLYSISPVITAICIDKPSSGSTIALGKALQMHRANGFAASVKTKANARLPYLCVDMGYSVRPDFTTVVHDHGFAPVMRYPVSRQTVWASEKPVFGSQSPGPVQINGAFYCPAALPLARQRRMVRPLSELLEEKDGFEAHDQALQKLLPLLMGTNSRPLRFVSKRKQTQDVNPVFQIDLVCPAVQGRVKCPLKPESLLAAFDRPEVKPTWSADRYRCCSKSQIRHTYTSEQWKLAQWGMVPGSWEHGIYYEAARSLTEQRFSIMKSQHLSGREHLKWSPRREPMISVIIALWIAATNIAIQDSHTARAPRPSSIRRQKRQLERHLGRELTSTPPRT